MSDVIVTVVGAGAVGTSIGLALKQISDPPQLYIHDKRPENTKEAMKLGAFDKAHWNLINACDQADLVVLAIPAAEIEATLKAIAADLKEDAIITDTAPTKAGIIKMAAGILPDNVHYVGGNPVVAVSGSGPKHARADLFKEAMYCLTPSPSVEPGAVQLLEDMARLMGATPFYLDPLEHDGLISAVNTLPAALSLALVNTVSEAGTWREMRRLAGGLFSQVSAGANGDPDSMAAELLDGKANIIRWIDAATESLQTLKGQIEAGDAEMLAQFIDKTVVARQDWQNDFESKALSNLQPESKDSLERPSLFKQLFGFGNKGK